MTTSAAKKCMPDFKEPFDFAQGDSTFRLTQGDSTSDSPKLVVIWKSNPFQLQPILNFSFIDSLAIH